MSTVGYCSGRQAATSRSCSPRSKERPRRSVSRGSTKQMKPSSTNGRYHQNKEKPCIIRTWLYTRGGKLSSEQRVSTQACRLT